MYVAHYFMEYQKVFHRWKTSKDEIVLLTNFSQKCRIIIQIRRTKNKHMSFNKDSAVQKAKSDLAKRLGVQESEIKNVSVSETDFPNMSLGAPAADEMSAQMISSGWKINLSADGKSYEYRADKYQLRLCGFGGTNHVIES